MAMEMEGMEKPAMGDGEGNSQRPSGEMLLDGKKEGSRVSRGLRLVMVVVNCAMLAVGTSGGPLIGRLYFKKGGKRRWLNTWLFTGGFPILLLPLAISFYHRRRKHPAAPVYFITLRLFLASAVIGLMTGVDDFLYAFGLQYLPVSTSAILISTQLAFTAFFAFLLVRQKFTPYSLNAVALLCVGAAVLGMRVNGDRPPGVSKAQYFAGFILTLGAAALYGLVLPLVELMYKKATQAITYTLVIEMQFVMGLSATIFCTIGMIVNNDFKVIPREAREYELGEVRYYVVLVWSAIIWQLFFLGSVGVIFCVHTLLAGVIIAVFIPVIEVFGVILYDEKFSAEKGVSLVLSLWGLASYSYGEYIHMKNKKKLDAESPVVPQSTAV